MSSSMRLSSASLSNFLFLGAVALVASGDASSSGADVLQAVDSSQMMQTAVFAGAWGDAEMALEASKPARAAADVFEADESYENATAFPIAGAWVTSTWGPCGGSCDTPVKHRTATCQSPLTGRVVEDSACSGRQKPIEFMSCSCDLELCSQVDQCSAPQDPITLGMPSYKEVGCFKLAQGDPGAACGAELDMGCLSWSQAKPCKSGFPFFSKCSSDGMSSETCFEYCLTQGLDMFAMVDGHECRCGASMVHKAWENLPAAGKYFNAALLRQWENATAGECSLRVFRYTGSYDAGGVPLAYITGSNEAGDKYIQSIALGQVLFEHDDATEGANAEVNLGNILAAAKQAQAQSGGREAVHQQQPARQGAASNTTQGACTVVGQAYLPGLVDCDDLWWKDHNAKCSALTPAGINCDGCKCPGDHPSYSFGKTLPLYRRNCAPFTCGHNGGPWQSRVTTAPAGVPAVWDDYVIIPYRFKSGIPNADKTAFRAAAEKWHQKTCVVFQETSPMTETSYVEVTKDTTNECKTNSFGRAAPNSVEIGSCSHGNMIHELGHVIGMTHEIQRVDAHDAYFGHGPYVQINWGNLAETGAYIVAQKSYVGSAHDGDGDVRDGYAPYDFASIMHYSPVQYNGGSLVQAFTILNSSVTTTVGQRTGLSDLDVIQVLDMYQCHANDASRHAKALKVRGPFCSEQHARLSTQFLLAGSTQDTKPYYVSAAGDAYLYFDSDCAGDGSGSPSWIFDTEAPSLTHASDLDQDGSCDTYAARSTTVPTISIWDGLPVGISQFKVDCGAGLSWQFEQASISGMTPLEASGLCEADGNGYFAEMGKTQSMRKYYANGKGYYLYYEPDCNGNAAWIIEAGEPSQTKASSLSKSGASSCHAAAFAYLEGDVATVPTGENTWKVKCSGSFEDRAVTISDSPNPPTPPPTIHPSCTDTDNGAVDAAGHTCAEGYQEHYPYWCGSYDVGTTFVASTMCCACGGGLFPTDSPSLLPTAFPSPAPTAAPVVTAAAPPAPATAVGDPHITNLLGESFDVNKPGEHVLLRSPFDLDLPAQLEVRAKMGPMSTSPCGLWITEVIFTGEWVGEEIRVRTASRDLKHGTFEHFALMVGSGRDSAQQRKLKWMPWRKFIKDAQVHLAGNVTMVPSFRKVHGAAAVHERRVFEFLVGRSELPQERVSVTVAQSGNPALDVKAKRVGKLGVPRMGGLLGTEDRDHIVEEISLKCADYLKRMGRLKKGQDWKSVLAHATATNNSASAHMGDDDYDQAPAAHPGSLAAGSLEQRVSSGRRPLEAAEAEEEAPTGASATW